MPHSVLGIPKHQGPNKRSHVEHKYQHHGFLRLKTNHLFGIDGGKGNGHSDTALVSDCASHQLHEVFVIFGFFKCLTQLLPLIAGTGAAQLRLGTLFHQSKCECGR